jgi:pyrroline-5-carboxylate reductase
MEKTKATNIIVVIGAGSIGQAIVRRISAAYWFGELAPK